MRQYYEAQEIVEAYDTPEFIRIDITDGTDKEKLDILQSIKDIMAGKKYTLKLHTCYHDGIPANKPCEMGVL